MRSIMVMALACWSGSGLAAEEQKPRIAVSGIGRVETPPDIVTIAYGVRGEGMTSDTAVNAMVAEQKAIDAGLASLTSAPSSASRVSITEVRGASCKRDDDEPRLSTGACAVIGYIAEIEMTVRTSAVKESGTIVSLLGRLKAISPHLDGFALANPEAAERRAMAAALIDARRRAETIAAGTAVKLGQLIVATTGAERGDGAQDIVVTANRRAPPLYSVAAPIAVDLMPRSIETQAQVTVTYQIAP